MTIHRIAGSIRLCGVVAGIAIAAGLGVTPAVTLAAAPGAVDLIATPPELTTSVSPNLMITLDDSGSMGRNFMPDQRPYSGNGWGATDQQNVNSNEAWPSGGGPYLCAGLIDPRVTDPADPRSWAMNGVYYNPNATYRPPLLADGSTEMPEADFNAAWDNGILPNRPASPTSSTTRNLATNARFCGNTAGYYRFRSGFALPLDANGRMTTAAISTLYTAANWEWVVLPAAERQNFANWYSYYHTRHLASKSAVSRAFAPFDESIRVAWQNINANQISNSLGIYKFRDPAGSNIRTRFYNWLFASPVGGGTPNQAAVDRVGRFFQRATGATDTNPYWDRDINRELSCRQNFHINMTDGFWNGGVVSTLSANDRTSPITLPDGRTYSMSDTESSIFWNELGPTQNTLANVAFYYWATDLRPDFRANASTSLKVPPFLPDKSTSLFGVPVPDGGDPRDNKEVYFNPANDPASWPHLVQFMIGFGVDGTIPRTTTALERLRRGTLAWPALLGSGNYTDSSEKMDDMWHAAVNSRGKYFAASNPEELISSLSEIIASIIARRGASTAVSVSLPLITDGTTGYTAGYDTTDWSGYLTRNRLDPTTGASTGIEWDAGCKLTGGACASMATTGGPARDPNSRAIITSNGTPGTGKPFRWGNLNTSQRSRLNVEPSSVRLDLIPQQWTPDLLGTLRLDYLRGTRTFESTLVPRFRTRGSLLGAVVKGEPVYVSSPTSGHRDIFPAGSPEASAYASGSSYARFQYDNRGRAPTVYVAANDGMMHAVDAATGVERWAYVPNTVIDNFRLVKTTQSDGGLVPTVDDAPQVLDVFIGGQWKTVLIGSLRLGGRGIYALDITNPAGISESNAVNLPMWEYSNVAPATGAGGNCAPGGRYCTDLGYTYDSVQIARIAYQNKWVALVSSGYFPIDPLDPANRELAAGRTSLLVIDLQTGQLIRKIDTSDAPQAAGVTTYGMSTAVVYDFGSDQIDDIAVAGDLAGNLWRFDLSDADNPNNWSVDLMFTSYGNGGAAVVGDQPISFNPTAMRDLTTLNPIFVFGTGKYIGLSDRTSAIPEQAFYGVRDYGTNSPNYPIRVNQLVTQTVAQDAGGVRSVTTANTIPDTRRGWRIRLNIPGEGGERAQRRAIPFFTSNFVLLYSLIPRGEDPCDPGNRYALMLVDGGTGSLSRPDNPAGTGIVGGVLSSNRPPGNPLGLVGGGRVVIPDLPIDLPPEVRAAINDTLSTQGADPVWNRGAWRELLDWR